MTSLASQRVVFLCHSVAFGLGIILLGSSQYARAGSNPDIPRLQAEAERGSIKEEVELNHTHLM